MNLHPFWVQIEYYTKSENIWTTMKETRITFYGQPERRMKQKRLVDKILTFHTKRKTRVPWLNDVHQDRKKPHRSVINIDDVNIDAMKHRNSMCILTEHTPEVYKIIW